MSLIKGLSLLLFINSLNASFPNEDIQFVVNNENFDGFLRKKIGNLELSIGEKIILKTKLQHGETEPRYFAELGTTLKTGLGLPMFCNNEEENDSICVTWENEIFVRIKVLNSFCHEVIWNSPAEDCISYGNANWYGGPELYEQLWPVEKLIINKIPYVTSSSSSLAEPFWINSKGIFLFVHYDVPLFIDSNNERNNSLCLISNNTFPYNPLQKRNVDLKYTVCQLNNPRKAYEYAIQHKFISVPSGIPDTRMVEHPIWSTWVQFKADINETAVLNFADSIMYYGFNNSQLEIDDMWETCYGDMVLNEKRFPKMKLFTKKLKKNGFRITLWHHPFINTDCGNYSFLKNDNFFVKNSSGYDISHWWDGVGSVYDFTNPEVKNWFRVKHKAFLEENGIDGYKFDAGESSIIPMNSLLNADPNDYPKSFTKAYIDTISVFGGITETRVGHGTQNYPIFLRMLDKDSKWDLKNGLATVITTCLLMNVQGYAWVLPDMVGGNAYGVSISEELFVRWLQVNTFMPVIQFSYAPWNFKNVTIVEISKKFTSLHYSYSSTIIDLMKRTVKTGAPLNPPIWWVDPTNPVAHKIDSEYMLGEDILVAPVLEEGATERDIYLPSGSWKDGNNEKNIYKGPCWMQKYPADLSTLPYFIKIPSQNK